jgi:TM2 domain-containing membrane protein YozV
MVHPSDPPKDPVLMCILSGLFVGLGQIVMGQTAKGIVMILFAIFAGLPLALVTLGLSIPGFWAVAAVDAYKIANKLKQGTPVGAWEFF